MLAAWLLVAPTRAESRIGVAGDVPRAPRPLCGRLAAHDGLPTLELWGTPEQAGYAHGFLLARHIVDLIDGYMLDPRIMPNPQAYETLLVPNVRRQFTWGPAQERELQALLGGMRDRLGPGGVRSRILDRELAVEDLMAANALADWFGMLCSTFSAWGPLTTDGQTLTARNLDFPSTSIMEQLQLVVIRRGDADRHSWIGVSWPGLIGVYTAMSDAGVTMLMHDAAGLPPSEPVGFTPRALILREALESATAADFVEDVRAVFRKRRVLVGNNIHVSGPHGDGRPPAVVFEYDANPSEEGVTTRTAATSGTAVTTALWCTNHLRLRRPPHECWRYGRLDEQLTRMREAGRQLDPEGALELIRSVKQETTLHSVCFVPHQKTMYVIVPAVREGVAEFELDDWSRDPAERAGRSAPAPSEGEQP